MALVYKSPAPARSGSMLLHRACNATQRSAVQRNVEVGIPGAMADLTCFIWAPVRDGERDWRCRK
jgi:hypothetical protein